ELSNILRHRIVSRNHLKAYVDKPCDKDVYFIAVTTYPSQIQFDIRLAKDDHDYMKAQACAPICRPEKPEKPPGNINMFVWIVMATIIGIIVFCLIRYGIDNNGIFKNQAVVCPCYN